MNEHPLVEALRFLNSNQPEVAALIKARALGQVGELEAQRRLLFLISTNPPDPEVIGTA